MTIQQNRLARSQSLTRNFVDWAKALPKSEAPYGISPTSGLDNPHEGLSGRLC